MTRAKGDWESWIMKTSVYEECVLEGGVLGDYWDLVDLEDSGQGQLRKLWFNGVLRGIEKNHGDLGGGGAV